MDADWSQLPHDLLGQIATGHLNTVEDVVMFSCVCRSWYHTFTMVKDIWDPSSRQMPWLMLAEPDKIGTTSKTTSVNSNNNDGWRKLFSPSRNKCYNFMLPEALGRRCWGSDYGWIVTLGIDLEMHLLNPLTKVRQSLPSQRTFQHQRHEHDFDELSDDSEILLYYLGEEVDYYHIRNHYVHIVRVFKMPKHCNNHHLSEYQFVVMAVHGEFRWISYAKCGDPSWMPITTTSLGSNVDDVAYCNGLVLILCYYNRMMLHVVSADLFQGSSSPLMAIDFLLTPRSLIDIWRPTFRLHMFESFGDLFMVARLKNIQDLGDPETDVNWWWNNEVKGHGIHLYFYETEGFQVFKFDFHDKQWNKIKDLGDRAQFLGENGCISVRASTAVCCRRNSIYFTDDERVLWSAPEVMSGHDMGIYNMDDGYIRPVYQGDDMHSNFSCPFWFMPNLNYYSI